jgi:hypothetical protein
MNGGIERVVVPLDAASDHGVAIETAARLAASAKAPLHGVFVEDEELLQAAGLAFTRQSSLGAEAEPFTPDRMAAQLRAAAERARQELATVAERNKLAWSFEIVRGASRRALVGMTERDLVVAGGLSRPVAGHFRLESRWFEAVETTTVAFLLVRHAWSGAGAVVSVLRDRSPVSVRLLEAAARVAEARGGGLTVISSPEIAGAAGFESWIGERLAAYAVPLQIEIAPSEPAVFERRIVELGCRVLAIEAGVADGVAARLRERARRFACDILVVR